MALDGCVTSAARHVRARAMLVETLLMVTRWVEVVRHKCRVQPAQGIPTHSGQGMRQAERRNGYFDGCVPPRPRQPGLLGHRLVTGSRSPALQRLPGAGMR